MQDVITVWVLWGLIWGSAFIKVWYDPYADGGRAGLQAWLLYCAEAYAAGAEASPLRG